MARARGLAPGAEVLRGSARPPSTRPGRLRVAPAAEGVELTRLRTLDGVPVCVDVSVVVLEGCRRWPAPT